MKTKFVTIIIILFGFQSNLFAQDESELTYNLKFIKAVKANKTKTSILAIFEVTPKDVVDFPPIIGGKYTVDINNQEMPEVLFVPSTGEKKLSINLFGMNEPEKPSKIHNLIKTLVDFDSYDDVLFFVLRMNNISEEPIEEMYLKFGFWEKNNQEKRIEQEFEFEVN